MQKPNLASLTLLFFRVGNTTFGGGNPTMAALHNELVTSRPWLTADQYGLCFGLARVTPGTNILAFCAGAAWQLLGWPAALLAVLAVVVPSALIVLALSGGYDVMQRYPLAMAAVSGTLAAATGLMATAAWQLLKPHAKRGRWLRGALIFSVSLVLAAYFHFSPLPVLALAAFTGFFWQVK